VKGKAGICSVCNHPKRREMEVGLVCLIPLSVLAARYDISRDSLHRHKRDHLTATQKAAILSAIKPSAVDLEELQRSESEGLLGQLLAQRATLQQYSAAAFEAGNLTAAIQAERAVTGTLELTSKLLGMLVQRHEVTHASILISGDYIALRSALLTALKPYPDAARAVGHALHELETRAASAIRERAADGKRPLIEHEAGPLQ
jgi:hypothetical protein